MIENIGNSFDIDLFRDFRARANGPEETAESTQNTAQYADGEQPREADNTNGVRNVGGATETEGRDAEKTDETNKPRESRGPADENDGELTEEEKQKVQELKETDRKVRQHEMAHLAAAQGIAVSGASFEYKRGPDGVNYAVGGEVSIDTSRERDPEATIDKARRIAGAALAPADPSPQDRSVAAKARQMEANARAELAREAQKESKDAGDPGTESPFKTQTVDSGKTASAAESPAKASRGFDDQPHPGIAIYERNQASVGGFGGGLVGQGESNGFGAAGNTRRPGGFGAFTPSAPMLDLVA